MVIPWIRPVQRSEHFEWITRLGFFEIFGAPEGVRLLSPMNSVYLSNWTTI